ncbi:MULTISPECIES: hypothetical protein [Planktothricoides]|uniref:Uncharacterized protein n=2 Tax=Planktothricoides raciborskii TaxID=132608 RepID=A0AAU8JM22_9CYAN|nr:MULTISPECIES: hypothetical protein [Planktothricoides]MBD2543514.1 hypothetical protein [Planktothricoides raciborskii FACHB-1370]MBD2581204.1 hypothetical protein [Planktothricoides raciborskii FACHB-1261]
MPIFRYLSEDLSSLVCLIHEDVRLGWHIQIHYILYRSGLPEKIGVFGDKFTQNWQKNVNNSDFSDRCPDWRVKHPGNDDF